MNKKKKNLSSSDYLPLVASLAIGLLLMTAGMAKALDPIANWPDLKPLLNSKADTKALTLSRGASLVLNASNAVLAPDLSLLQVNSVKGPTVVIPANGVLAFAVDVTEPMYVTSVVSLAADPDDLRPGLRAYVLSDSTVIGVPMIYQKAPPGGQINFDLPGKMPDNRIPLRTWRLEAGRHYIRIVGPRYRSAGTFESIKLVALAGTPKTPEYTFAQITDTHIGRRRGATALVLGKTLNALRQEGLSFAIITGDMTSTSEKGQFGQLAEAIAAGGGLHVYGVIGNHDGYETGSRDDAIAVPGLFPTGKTNYDFYQKPLRFVVVDGSYWQRASGEFVDWLPADRIANGMGPDGEQWLIDTLAADLTTPTVLVSHYPFQLLPGNTQCGYVMDAQSADMGTIRHGGPGRLGGQINDIIAPAPNVIATMSGHTHFNNTAIWQNDHGDDIISLNTPAFGFWPGGYRIIRVYSDGNNVRLEWETRVAENLGQLGTDDPKLKSFLAKSWKISTSHERDLVSEPAGTLLLKQEPVPQRLELSPQP